MILDGLKSIDDPRKSKLANKHRKALEGLENLLQHRQRKMEQEDGVGKLSDSLIGPPPQ